MKHKRLGMLLTVGLACSLAMAWVDGVLQPGYVPKSAIKICLFFLLLAGLALAGVMFDYLNEKQETIYMSWFVHMCANFAINTVGFILL